MARTLVAPQLHRRHPKRQSRVLAIFRTPREPYDEVLLRKVRRVGEEARGDKRIVDRLGMQRIEILQQKLGQ